METQIARSDLPFGTYVYWREGVKVRHGRVDDTPEEYVEMDMRCVVPMDDGPYATYYLTVNRLVEML